MRRVLLVMIVVVAAGGVAAAVASRDEGRTVLATDKPSSTTSSTSSTSTTSTTEVTTSVAPLPVPETAPSTTALPSGTKPHLAPAVTVRLPPTTVVPRPTSQAERLAAVSGPGLYLVDLDGTNLRRVVAGGAGFPAWSPDGSRVAYTVGGELWIATPDAVRTRVAATAVVSRYGPSWSSDGKRIAFPGTGGDASERDAWIATTDGAPAVRIAHPGDDAAVALSPHDRLAVMGSQGEYVSDDAGGAWRRLGDSSYNFGELLWSPSGSRLALIPDSMSFDHVFDITAGSMTVIGGDEPHRIDGAAWCPDGDRLVLEGYYRDRQIFGTWLASAGGGPPTLIGRNDGDATCLPNDRVLAVQQGGSGATWALVTMALDGSDRRPLLSYGSDGYRSLGHPRLSPDGKTIAFVAYR